MIVDFTDSRSAFALLALNGEVVGRVVKACVARREDGGFVVVRIDDESDEHALREGDVAYLGDARHDGESGLVARRVCEERQRLGLSPAPSLERELYAGSLETLALRVRGGQVTVLGLSQACEFDRFPLPDGETQYQPTGEVSYRVNYVHGDAAESHARALKAWSEAHPDLVPEYVRGRREGDPP